MDILSKIRLLGFYMLESYWSIFFAMLGGIVMGVCISMLINGIVWFFNCVIG